jgi:hypothetical protein
MPVTHSKPAILNPETPATKLGSCSTNPVLRNPETARCTRYILKTNIGTHKIEKALNG